MRMIDAGTWKVTITFEDGMALCEKLKLVEMMQHGDVDYSRFTQKGINILATLTELMKQMGEASEAGDVLKVS